MFPFALVIHKLPNVLRFVYNAKTRAGWPTRSHELYEDFLDDCSKGKWKIFAAFFFFFFFYFILFYFFFVDLGHVGEPPFPYNIGTG